MTRLINLLNGAGGQALTNTATRIGVGNGAGTAAVGDTDLSAAAGAACRYFMTMDATYPSTSGAVLTARSTFGSADGNFAWNSTPFSSTTDVDRARYEGLRPDLDRDGNNHLQLRTS